MASIIGAESAKGGMVIRKTNVDITAFLSFSTISHSSIVSAGLTVGKRKKSEIKVESRRCVRLWTYVSVFSGDPSWDPFCFRLSDYGTNCIFLPVNPYHIFVVMLVIQDLNIFFFFIRICLSFKYDEFNSPYLLLNLLLVILGCSQYAKKKGLF